MKKIYKYSFSRHTLSLTTIYLTIFLALGIGLYFLYEGGYLSAWFFSFIVALVALMSLSIPRRILVDDEGLHILCLLDITELHPEEIASVRQVEKQELRGYVPYFGGYGFFGFYGHYFDLKNLERVKIYASEWRNFVEITDIYENRIYVSCTQGEELVNDLRELISHARERRAQELQSQETTETRQFPPSDVKTKDTGLYTSPPLSQILFPKGISIHYLPQKDAMLCISVSAC